MKTMKKKDIEQAAADAVKVIAAAASEAARTVANAAAEAVKVSNVKGADDHDLLVVLNTKMEDLKTDIQDLKDGTSTRIATLENEKLNIRDSYPILYKKDVDTKFIDHEKRIKTIESLNTKLSVMLGIGIGILSFLVSLMIYHILGK